jgi:hypothetical protein
MPRFTVTTHHEVEANDQTHAAQLVYRELSIEPTPLEYSVVDAAAMSTTIRLNVRVAEQFVYQSMRQQDGTEQLNS